MRKRRIALTMAVAMLTSLAGGSVSVCAEETNMTMFWWGNQVRNERTQTILDMFSEENPGVTFDGQFADGTDYWTRLATLSAGGTLPDVIQMDYLYIAQYANNGLLLDLTPYPGIWIRIGNDLSAVMDADEFL